MLSAVKIPRPIEATSKSALSKMSHDKSFVFSFIRILRREDTPTAIVAIPPPKETAVAANNAAIVPAPPYPNNLFDISVCVIVKLKYKQYLLFDMIKMCQQILLCFKKDQTTYLFQRIKYVNLWFTKRYFTNVV